MNASACNRVLRSNNGSKVGSGVDMRLRVRLRVRLKVRVRLRVRLRLRVRAAQRRIDCSTGWRSYCKGKGEGRGWMAKG